MYCLYNQYWLYNMCCLYNQYWLYNMCCLYNQYWLYNMCQWKSTSDGQGEVLTSVEKYYRRSS